MGSTLLRWFVLVLVSASVVAQQGSGRRETEIAARVVAAGELTPEEIEAGAGVIVDLLRDDRAAVRHRALALVLAHAPVFGPQWPRLADMLRTDPSTTLRTAASALAPFAPSGIDSLLATLSRGRRDRERVAKALGARPREAVAALDRILESFRDWTSQPNDPIYSLVVKLAETDRPAVLAALGRRKPGPYGDVGKALLLDAVGAPQAMIVDTVVGCMSAARGGPRGLKELRARLLTESPEYRQKIAEIVASKNRTAARLALDELAEQPVLAAAQWSQLREGLGKSPLTLPLVRFAIAVREVRPDAIEDVMRFVRDASAAQLGAVVQIVPLLRDRFDAVRKALAPHLQLEDHVDLPLLDALVDVEAFAELRAAMPMLLEHSQPRVRSFAVQLVGLLGGKDPLLASVAALQEDASAVVRVEVEALLPLLRGELDEAGLRAMVADRDERRVLAVYGSLRRKRARITTTEEAAFVQLAHSNRWSGWLPRSLRADFSEGRAGVDTCRRMMNGAWQHSLWTSTGLWRDTPLAAAPASPAETGKPGAQPNLLRRAARDPRLRDRLIQRGMIDARDVPTAAALEAWERAVAECAGRHLQRLGSDTAGKRSDAFTELQRLPRELWQTMAGKLRRGGNRHQRRLLAVLEAGASRDAAWRLLDAPEVGVATLALQRLLPRDGRVMPAEEAARCAQQLVANPGAWCNLLATPRSGGALALTAAGAPAVELVGIALGDARCHRWAIQAAGLLGEPGRAFLPELVAALRTRHAASAAGSIFALGIDPSHPEFAAMRDAIEAEWAIKARRTELVPAVAALGDEHDDFAEEDCIEVMRMFRSRFGASDAGLDAWVALGLRTEGIARRRIAMLVLAAQAWTGGWASGSQASAGLRAWRAAAKSPALELAIGRAFRSVPEADVRSLVASVLEGAARDRALPATAAIVRQRCDLVFDLVRDPSSASLRRGPLLALLIDVVPGRMVRELLENGEMIDGHAKQLAQMPPTAAARKELGLWLRRAETSDAQRARAAALLARQGEGARATIVGELRAGGVRRKAMLTALQEAGSRVAFAAGDVVPFLRVDRDRALDVLGRMGGRGLSLAMREIESEQRADWLEARIPRLDPRTAGAGLRLLQQLSQPHAVRVAERLTSSDPGVRRWVGFILLDADHAGAGARILDLGRDEVAIVRARAAKALASISPWTDAIGVLATDLLMDDNLSVRRAAVAAFRSHPDQVAASVVALEEVRDADPDPSLRAEVDALLANRPG
ncbi:MAG: hypothetical protein AB8H80_09930 [Planctomycetota bacterium]